MNPGALLLSIFWLISKLLVCQEDIPCYGLSPGSEDSWENVSDSSGYWFTPKADTTLLVFISKGSNIYRHYKKSSMRLMVEGDFGGRVYTDRYMRFGKWTEYFPDGTSKTIGYYYMDQPIGEWQFYYENGQLKERYNIALIESKPSSSYCRTGSYEYYYANGQLKVSGLYKASVDSTTEKRIDYLSGKTYSAVCHKPVSKPFGIWTYYSESGIVERREEFDEFIDPHFWYDRR